MNREYPYLLNSYYESMNQELLKEEFLFSLNDLPNQHQYVQITLLDWNENPIKSISGDIVSGSITKDGNSQARRTCSLSCSVSGKSYEVENLNMDFSINKKIFLELGIRNDTDEFKDYDILWFPQGVFFIRDFSINSSSSSSVGISITLQDKIGMLDGTIGGIIPATTILDEMDTQIGSELVTKKVLLYDLITELVNHFGKEDLDKIVIEDVPRKIKRIVRWLGDCECYIWQDQTSDGKENTYVFATEDEKDFITLPEKYDTFIYGDDIGYTYEDLVYDQELTVTAGTSVANVLDTIKNYLGNYEYFYDEFGVFHFREIKNYLNNSLSSSIMEDTSFENGFGNDMYMSDINVTGNIYSITDKNMISITNTPQYSNIKNDFIVQGTRKAENSDISYDVRYHVAIDEKPEINKEGYSGILIYIDKDTGNKTLCIPEIIYPGGSQALDPSIPYLDNPENADNCAPDPSLPEYGELGVIYGLLDEKKDFTFIHTLDSEDYLKNSINSIEKPKDDDYVTSNNYLKYYNYLLNALKKYESSENNDNLLTTIAFELKYIIKKWYISGDNEDVELLINKYTDGKDEKLFYKEHFFIKIKDKEWNKNKIESELKNINNSIKYYENNLIPLAESIVSNSEKILEKIDKEELGDSSYKKYYDSYLADMDYLEYLKAILENLYEKKRYLIGLNNINSGTSNPDIEYDTEEVTYKAFQTSFYIWTNDGWEELEWIKYYNNTSENVNYHYTNPFGISSYKYYKYEEKYFKNYDASKIETWPNNNMHSNWYQNNIDNKEYCGPYIAKEWRTEIILQGLQSELAGTDDASYYYEELVGMWPTMYDFEHQCFYSELEDEHVLHKSLTQGNYYLDFISPSAAQVGEFCVDNIGRRTYVNISEDINCLFEPEIPDIIFVNIDKISDSEMEEIRNELYSTNEKLIQLKTKDFSRIGTGGVKNAAFDQIKYDILTHTIYQRIVSLTAIPMFFFEPNTRISIDSDSAKTYGNFIASNISIPLGPGNQMSVSCNEVFEKI